MTQKTEPITRTLLIRESKIRGTWLCRINIPEALVRQLGWKKSEKISFRLRDDVLVLKGTGEVREK